MVKPRLTTKTEVLRIAGLTEQYSYESGSDILDAIDDVSADMRECYGDPVKKTSFSLNRNFTKYDFTGNKNQTYIILDVTVFDDINQGASDTYEYELTEADSGDVSGSVPAIAGQYYVDLNDSYVCLNETDISTYDGNRCDVEFIPFSLSRLCAIKSAIYVLETLDVAQSESITMAKIERLEKRATKFETNYSPNKVFGSEEQTDWDEREGDFIIQDHQNYY